MRRRRPLAERDPVRAVVAQDVAKLLATLRDKQVLTLEELAWKAGVHRNSIVNAESGEHDVGIGTVFRMANGLDGKSGPKSFSAPHP